MTGQETDDFNSSKLAVALTGTMCPIKLNLTYPKKTFIDDSFTCMQIVFFKVLFCFADLNSVGHMHPRAHATVYEPNCTLRPLTFRGSSRAGQLEEPGGSAKSIISQ